MRPLTVVLIGYVVYASDDCAAEPSDRSGVWKTSADEQKDPIMCYECSTEANEFYCGDPFNRTYEHLVKRVKCLGACAKWVKKPKYGPVNYVRRCSSNLNLGFPVAYVCMKESRPGDGRLCFCDKDYCNAATRLNHNGSAWWPALLPWLLSILTLCVVSMRTGSTFPVVPACSRKTTCWTHVIVVAIMLVVALRARTNCSAFSNKDIKDINTG